MCHSLNHDNKKKGPRNGEYQLQFSQFLSFNPDFDEMSNYRGFSTNKYEVYASLVIELFDANGLNMTITIPYSTIVVQVHGSMDAIEVYQKPKFH